MFKRPLQKIVIPLLLLGGLFACASSLQMANRFVVEETDIHVLVLPPGSLMKTHLPEHPDSIAAGEIPEFDEAEIRFVSNVDDSVYISTFMDALERHLERLAVTVYGLDDMDDFFKLDQPAYIFFIAQMELMEYRHTERFLARDGQVNYVRNEPITVLENNTWFEFLKLHDEDFGMEILFSVQATGDLVDGRFIRRRSGEVVFDAERYLLTREDVIDLAEFSGEQNAQNIFDHLMNIFVVKQMGWQPNVYYRYDVESHTIRQTDQPSFIKLESPEPGAESDEEQE